MGFGIRIAPGVRISASKRGVRAGIGPRAARIHVGSGRTGISTGTGPFTAWEPLSGSSGGRRRSRGGSSVGGARSSGGRSATSLAAYERASRQAQKLEQVQHLEQLELAMLRVHLEAFPPVSKPAAPAAAATDRSVILKRLRAAEQAGIPWWRVQQRLDARKRAGAQLAAAVIAEDARRQAEQADAQQAIEAAWSALLANQLELVMGAAEHAFEDNAAPAAPIDVEGDRLSVTMLYGTPDLVPDEKPALTPTGKPTLKRRNKGESADLYAQSLASNVLATAKEAFAVPPGINRVTVLVASKDIRAATADAYLTAIYCGTFHRTRFEQLAWNSVDPLQELYLTPDALISRKGRSAEISPIDLKDEPELQAVMQQIEDGLRMPAS